MPPFELPLWLEDEFHALLYDTKDYLLEERKLREELRNAKRLSAILLNILGGEVKLDQVELMMYTENCEIERTRDFDGITTIRLIRRS